MKAKSIKALDNLIAALEEVKACIEAEANKSGDSTDDEGAVEVPKRGRPAKTAAVPRSRKPAVEDDTDDDADVDGDDDTDADDDEDLPAPKAPVKSKAKPAAKPAAKGKAKADAADMDAVKKVLTQVMNEESLGKAAVVKILKKHGATRSADLEEDDYAAVIKAAKAALASVEDDDGEDDDDV